MEIPFYRNYVDEAEAEAVAAVARRGMHWAIGPEIAEFEQRCAELLQVKHAVAFSSGTTAGHALMHALGVAGGEVIVPSFTFIATANVTLLAGAKPVFADVEPRTLGLDAASVAAVINDRTRAIMPVHYGGCPCDMASLRELAQAHGIPLVEDAAEALGSRLEGVAAGALGDAAWFSFAPSKLISTGEGGLAVTDSAELTAQLRLFRSHGRTGEGDYFESGAPRKYVALGHNFRMPSICAAQGLAQLDKLERIITLRRERAERYAAAFAALPGVVPFTPPQGHFHTYMLYTVLLEEGRETRDALQAHLTVCGVSSKVYFDPVHLTPFYRQQGYRDRLPVTERLGEQALSLPVYPGLGEPEQAHVIAAVSEFMERQ